MLYLALSVCQSPTAVINMTSHGGALRKVLIFLHLLGVVVKPVGTVCATSEPISLINFHQQSTSILPRTARCTIGKQELSCIEMFEPIRCIFLLGGDAVKFLSYYEKMSWMTTCIFHHRLNNVVSFRNHIKLNFRAC